MPSRYLAMTLTSGSIVDVLMQVWFLHFSIFNIRHILFVVLLYYTNHIQCVVFFSDKGTLVSGWPGMTGGMAR